MYNVTNLSVTLIVTLLTLLVVLNLFMAARLIYNRKFFKRLDINIKKSKSNLNSIKHNFYIKNPIIIEHPSYFKVYKLNKNYKPTQFFEINPNESTVFIKQETNYDNIKNNY
ncbi:MAG: hypothetical protein FWG20_01175 [Candidatus Cloacimonetes bacterium]|nr:hypothetical protein [Candidatus Cloacimonadota bacterium]